MYVGSNLKKGSSSMMDLDKLLNFYVLRPVPIDTSMQLVGISFVSNGLTY